MKAVLTLPIHIYWLIWPKKYKRKCIFRESCSRHVHRVAIQNGLLAGVLALIHRFKSCRSGYFIVPSDSGVSLRLFDGSVITANEAAPDIVAPFFTAADRLEQELKAGSRGWK